MNWIPFFKLAMEVEILLLVWGFTAVCLINTLRNNRNGGDSNE